MGTRRPPPALSRPASLLRIASTKQSPVHYGASLMWVEVGIWTGLCFECTYLLNPIFGGGDILPCSSPHACYRCRCDFASRRCPLWRLQALVRLPRRALLALFEAALVLPQQLEVSTEAEKSGTAVFLAIIFGPGHQHVSSRGALQAFACRRVGTQGFRPRPPMGTYATTCLRNLRRP